MCVCDMYVIWTGIRKNSAFGVQHSFINDVVQVLLSVAVMQVLIST